MSFAKAKAKFDVAKCLLTKTGPVCAYERVLADVPSVLLGASQVVNGQSARYSLVSPNDHWFKLWPNTVTKTDLQLMHQTSRAQITAAWAAGEQGTHDEQARTMLQPLADKLGIELETVALDVWPYNEAGVFYSVCYPTNKETQECFFSVAATIPNGVVSFFVFVESDEVLVEEVMAILSSLEVMTPHAS